MLYEQLEKKPPNIAVHFKKQTKKLFAASPNKVIIRDTVSAQNKTASSR